MTSIMSLNFTLSESNSKLAFSEIKFTSILETPSISETFSSIILTHAAHVIPSISNLTSLLFN